MKDLMEVEKQQDMILICLNVFIVDFVKSRVQSTRLWKDQIFYFELKKEKNIITINTAILALAKDKKPNVAYSLSATTFYLDA